MTQNEPGIPKETEMQQDRSNAGALVVGAIMIAFGLLSLTGQLFRAWNWEFLWPFTIIGFGVLLFAVMFVGGRQSAALAIPGSIVSGIGLVMLFQSLTHHWESMSYFWTLIILFIGSGIYIMGWRAGEQNQKQSGLRLMKIGFVLFIGFGIFFEIIFSSFNNFLLPAFLIVLGAYLVLSRAGLFGEKKSEGTETLPPAS
jgi:hypothetical protein